jgi:hypothetical protein
MYLFLKYIFNESTGAHNPDVLCAPSKYPVSGFVYGFFYGLMSEKMNWKYHLTGVVFMRIVF